jgi:ligand-binding SRPBCC domain-containing protein
MTKQYEFKTEQYLPIDIHNAWLFFSSPKNLPHITPPDLRFNVLTLLSTTEVYDEMVIDYLVHPVFNIPMRWQAMICNVRKPYMFTDRQLKGPYKEWEHTHVFKEKGAGVVMTDVVKYKMPFGIIGMLAHELFIRKRIRKIFEYRRQTLNLIFKSNDKYILSNTDSDSVVYPDGNGGMVHT